MLTQFAPTFYMDMSACLHIPKTTPWPIWELSVYVRVHTLILMKGCAGISISKFTGTSVLSKQHDQFFLLHSVQSLQMGQHPVILLFRGLESKNMVMLSMFLAMLIWDPAKWPILVAGSLLWFSCHMWQIRGLPKKPNPKKGWLIGNYIQGKCII